MKAVLSVIGQDRVGIMARISNECAEYGVNILDVSQTVLQNMFCMIMICDTEKLNTEFGVFCEHMESVGKEMNMSVKVMHEDLFNSMHKI